MKPDDELKDTKLEAYQRAMMEILYPVAAMRKQLQEGEVLDGYMAIQLAQDPAYLRNIAEKVIRENDPEFL